VAFLLRITLILGSLFFSLNLLAQDSEVKKADNHSPDIATPPTTTPLPIDSDSEVLDDAQADLDPLEYTQKELQGKFTGGFALNLGPVMPWADYGASIFWSRYGIVQSLSLGAGDFEFSDNYKERNYQVEVDSQSMYYAARWFFLGFGPLYIEPFAGFVRWSGSIKPNGFDDTNDTLSASLNSRFDITGVSLGANLGLMWIFTNGIFLDYNLFNLSSAAFTSKRFTTNTAEAKKNVKKALEGPLTMSNLQLRVGYSIKI
jgi:hypothetical protein